VKQISDNEIYLLIKYIKKRSLESSKMPVLYRGSLKVNIINVLLKYGRFPSRNALFDNRKQIRARLYFWADPGTFAMHCAVMALEVITLVCRNSMQSVPKLVFVNIYLGI